MPEGLSVLSRMARGLKSSCPKTVVTDHVLLEGSPMAAVSDHVKPS